MQRELLQLRHRSVYDIKKVTDWDDSLCSYNRPISSCINLTWNLLSKAFINLDLSFVQNLFPELVIAQDNAWFRVENIYSKFWRLY